MTSKFYSEPAYIGDYTIKPVEKYKMQLKAKDLCQAEKKNHGALGRGI